MRVRPVFAWYDFWVGAYWDRMRRRLFVVPLPMLGLVVEFRETNHDLPVSKEADMLSESQYDKAGPARPWFYRWVCSCGSVGRNTDAGLVEVRALHRGHDLSVEGETSVSEREAHEMRTATHDPVSGRFYIGPVEPGRYRVIRVDGEELR